MRWWSGRVGKLVGLAVVSVGIASGCSGSGGPASPSPPTPTPPPVVTPPVVRAINVQPAGPIEVGDEVTLAVEIEDAETPEGALRYEWSATTGLFEGSGRVVRWSAPEGTPGTPLEVVVSVTVIEPYQVLENGTLVGREHRVTREAAPFRLHDSKAEISQMVLTFLIDLFGNSDVDADECLVDFSDGCRGKEAEREDIEHHRDMVDVLRAEATITQVLVSSDRRFASIRAACEFRDRWKATGVIEDVTGTCLLTAIYEDDRWWLCSSNFNSASVSSAEFLFYHQTRGASPSQWPSIAGSLRSN